MMELVAALYAFVRVLIAAYGALYLVVHVVVPCAKTAGRFLCYELPEEVNKWQRHWAQEDELQRLETRLAVLKKRKEKSKKRRSTDEEVLTDFMSAEETQPVQPVQGNLDVHETAPQEEPILDEVEEVPAESVSERRNRLSDEENVSENEPVAKKRSIKRPTQYRRQPLSKLSSNAPESRSTDEKLRKRNAAKSSRPYDIAGETVVEKQASRVLSLGNIFEEAEEENYAPFRRMTKRTTVVLVCGLPGAGKTTLVRRFIEAQADDPDTSVCYETICFDELFLNAYDAAAPFDPAQWKAVQQKMTAMITTQVTDESAETESYRPSRLVLLVDDNFPYRSQRKRFFQIAKAAKCGFGIVHLETPVSTCRSRNRSRVGLARVPDDAFERMVQCFEPPGAASVTHEMNTVVMGSDDVEELRRSLAVLAAQAEEIHQNIEKAAQHEARRYQQKQEDLKATKENLVHGVDVAVRQWISCVMQGRDGDFAIQTHSKAQVAKWLNDRRKSLLASVRAGEIPDSGTMEQGGVASIVEQFQRTLLLEFKEKSNNS
ncbi:hypothetical protein Poli38472_002309 [Pythium oligandrum]|uniref:AAA+ ATPase domain-containing protein n=1 Tax=Pythium oligandrum TaxID=41045 RepID=A0A8K1CJ24_PYTOL|nr:hypothetical protein Poli38472_002309 [Pythium oligandrum]|eukprot:TMW63368.1 hypothetical protein Poli38472_002309 [Pythium oligandrum]